MADRSLDFAMRVSADAREGIEVFRALKKGAVDTKREFEQATAKVTALAQQLAAAEKPSAALKREFEAAKRQAAGLKDALEQQEQRLNSSRQSLTQAGVNVKQLASEYRRLKAEAAAASAAQVEAAAAQAKATAAAAAAQARSSRLDAVGKAISGSTPDALGALGVRSSAAIEGDILKVQQALQRLSGDARVSGAEFDRAFAAGNKRIAALRAELDPTTASVARLTGGASDLRTQLGPLQSALAGVAAAMSAQRVLALAEEYQQYTARLRLATQYTGDFLQVQAALRDVARDSLAPIAETVNLYSRLAPSLYGMGRNGLEAASVIGTVNKAIALSGASAGASEAALVQFGQAMGSGVLRGEELNSILEQTPALADAIAEGMGRTRGELKSMGEQGLLTSQEVVRALENVAARVDRDFSQMPVRIGQSFTLLRNETVELVGGMDRVLGATSGIASGMTLLADNLEELVRFGVPLLVAALIPLVVRLGLTTAAAVKAAIALAAVSPVKAAIGVAAAVAAYAGLNAMLEEVAESKDTLTPQEQEQALKRDAEARLKVEQDLASARERLNNLWLVSIGAANEEILLDEKARAAKQVEIQRKAIADQIRGYESLSSTLNGVWDTAISKARELREESARLLRDAGDARQSGTDKAQDRRMRGWSEADRDAYSRRQAQDLTDSARSSALFARNAAFSGNMERAAQLAAEAAKFAERAEKYADQITDDDVAANLFEELGQIREEALKAQAAIKEREAKAQEDLAAAVNAQITENEERLKSLRAELEKPATIQADITQAEQQIQALERQLEQLKDKTVTVTVKTVTEGGAPVDSNAVADLPGRAYGGPLPGRAPHDRADNVIYRGTPGEWVIQRPAVRYWGASFMRAINEMRMPKFAYGGQLGADQRAALADSSAAPRMSGNTFVLDGQQYPVYTTPDVEAQLAKAFRMAALRRGSRK